MNAITIRNLSDEAARALEARAAENGTTVEVEAERILQEALIDLEASGVPPGAVEPRPGLGTAIRRIREQFPELSDVDFSRDQMPARGPSFE